MPLYSCIRPLNYGTGCVPASFLPPLGFVTLTPLDSPLVMKDLGVLKTSPMIGFCSTVEGGLSAAQFFERANRKIEVDKACVRSSLLVLIACESRVRSSEKPSSLGDYSDRNRNTV